VTTDALSMWRDDTEDISVGKKEAVADVKELFKSVGLEIAP